MSGHINRAAEALANTQEFNQMIDFGAIGDEVKIARQLVEAFDAAGLLASPERDHQVAARAWNEGHTAGVRNASAEFDGPVQDNPYKRKAGERDE